MHLRKLLNKPYHENPDKLIITSPPIDTAPPIAKSIVQLPTKQKQGQPTGHAKKRAK